ncbi:hypothetical protein FQA39_LY08576 [Lamprigera yunnana]|nr:hypothetical protein FQA39_LY08576 [Lamprigera yunnana]
MEFLLFGYLIYIATVYGERCSTPSGLQGNCVPLASCPSLWWLFSNPSDGALDILQKLICSNTFNDGIIVCCHVATNVDVVQEDADPFYGIQKLTNTEDCGTQDGQVDGDGIIGLYDFPWLVKVLFVNNEGGDEIEKVSCTGVLINKRYVLYTTQCHNTIITQEANYRKFFFSNGVLSLALSLAVRIETFSGNLELCNTPFASYNTDCNTFQIYKVELLLLHPFYDAKTKFNDLAVLRLNRNVKFSDYIRPICLPLTPITSKYNVTYTAGWNLSFTLTDLNVKSSYVSEAISNEECILKSNSSDIFIPYDMCTTSKNTIEDEVIGYPVMSFHNDRWYVQGFTSRGNQPKINVNVQNYIRWIKESMDGERCLTYDGEMGKCVYLTDCPTLMDSFVNFNSESHNMLQDFTCMYEHENIDTDALRVCCGTISNFTIVNSTNTETENILNISDFRFCGYQHRDDYLSFDDEIAIDEFPWLAAIVNGSDPLQQTSVCVGTLVNERYVLTSAQCIFSLNSADTMLVRLGDYNLKTEMDCIRHTQLNVYECSVVQEYGIEEQITHPFYNSSTFDNDIGLLRLDTTVIFTEYVRPICLPMSSTDVVELGEVLYITGFSKYLGHSKTIGLKKKIWTTLISPDICEEKLKLPSFYTPLADYHICTKEFQNSTDVTACVVNEGGPVMFPKKLQWYIIGISSTFSCGDIEPQIHLKVSKYLKWIRAKIKD